MIAGDSIATLERFIGHPTVSRDGNLPLIDHAAAVLQAAGAEISLTFDRDRRKANLLACLGPRDRPGIVLSGHTDVVPVEDQAWTTDPFTLTRRGDRLIGRGTCDMKGFLAIATAAAPRLAASRPDVPVILAMSYDEEVGCLGVPDLLADLARFVAPPRGCIVGEPTGMRVVAAHKGKIGCHVEVVGKEAHSSLSPIGVNAVEAAAEAIGFLTMLKRRFRDEGPHDPAFEAPDHATIEVCMARGGTAVNVIPNRCSFDFDVRSLPGTDPRTVVAALADHVATRIEPAMKAVDPRAGFAFTVVPGCAAFRQDPDAPFARLVRSQLPPHPPGAVPFGTEAGHFREAGIPTLVCGPGHIAQAHQPDEYLDVAQVVACEAFLDRLFAAA